MKRLAFLALMLVTACGESVERAPTGNGDGNLFATVDAVSFSGSLNVQAVRSGNTITISGFGANNRRLTIRTTGASAAGTYQLTGQNYGEFVEGLLTWSTTNTGGTGSVTFSRLDAKRGTGTFIFSAPATTATGAAGTKVITAGTFDVAFPD